MNGRGKLEVSKLFLEMAREQLASILGLPIEALSLVLDVSPEEDNPAMLKAASELANDTYPGRYVLGNEDEAALTIWHSQDMS